MIINETYTLSNGVKIPKVGFGTWQTKSGEEAYNSVLWALEAGYRHVDTAYAYGNEESVGKAIKDSGVKREELFVVTKLPAEIKSYDGAIQYFESSLKALGTGYIDLYLIHAPWPWTEVGKDCTDGNIEVWKAFCELYNSGKVKSIGVSNFRPENIEPLIKATGVKPMVNQIRYFVGNTQEAVSDYCLKEGILIEAYSPLATGELLENGTLNPLAQKYGKSVAKICLRYCLQKGVLPLPKSTHKERIFDNTDLDFKISAEDMAYLDSLHHIASTRKLRD
ncbi:MAG: aldo/keto reductase [Candidatus Coproplasma sp.]